MKNRAEQLIRACGRFKAGVLSVLALLGVLAALTVVCRGRFTNDLDRLFPDTREKRALFLILHDAHLADAVQLEFVSDTDITPHAGHLEKTAEKLKKCPLLREVTFRYRSDDPAAELASFVTLAPRFLPPRVLDACSPDAAAKNALKKLVFPAPGLVKQARMQPFGWEGNFLKSLRALDEATGMKLAREFPFFISSDRRRAMISAETNVRLGDADAVRGLYAELRRCVSPLPPGVELRIISGCSHTLGNEEVLKRDAAVSGGVSLALFLLLFLWACGGSRRALWIPVIPLYASLLALGIMTFLFRDICLYVIGLGGCITGLAVDQGIHVYTALKGEHAERRTAALGLPMLLSAATSIVVFAFLGLAGISAYCQLAVFAGLSLALSGVLALFVLPALLDRNGKARRLLPDFAFTHLSRRSAATAAAAGAILLIPALIRVMKTADFALESLDGTPEEILVQEREFRSAWRREGSGTAVLTAAGKDREEALEHLREITTELEKRGVKAVTPPRPPRRIQEKNRSAWRSPEVARKIAELAAACRVSCRKHGLPEHFFAPFFTALEKAVAAEDLSLPVMLEHIDRRMVKSHGQRAAAVALLDDTPQVVRTVRKLLENRREERAALLSKGAFAALIAEELGGRFFHLLILSISSALLLLFLVLRRLEDVLLAMIPVVLAWTAAAVPAAVTGFRATPAAAFAAVLLTGLAADYGIYAVCQLRKPDELDTRDAILLSAATTVAGAGALLLSHHPVLFGTGAVLAPGILAACLSGVYLVPRLKKIRPGKLPAVLICAAALPFLCGCAAATLYENWPEREKYSSQLRIYPETPFRVRALTTVRFGERQFRFVLAAKIDPGTGRIGLAAVDPGSGALLFQSTDETGARVRLNDAFAQNAPGPLLRFLDAFPDDLRRIFISKDLRPLAVETKREYIVVYADRDVQWRLYEDGTSERRGGGFFSGTWLVRCENGGRRAVCVRSGMTYSYTLDLSVDKLW